MLPKLRASCDVCHLAKIKCIKTDTGCQRCDNSAGELSCKFSPALPRVYRSHRNRSGNAQTSRPNPPTQPSLVNNSHGPNYVTQAAPGQVISEPVTTPVSTLHQQDYNIGINAESNSFLWPYGLLDSINMPQNLNAWPSNIDTASPISSTPALTDAVTPTDADPSVSLSPTAHSSRASIEQTTSHGPSATSLSGRTCAGAPCDCFNRLLEAMQIMSTYTTTQSPKLDVVLCANRTAAKLCLVSLQCSNPSGTVAPDTASSCSTIACGLLDRILVSYKTALEIFCANLDSERAKNSEEREHDDEGRTAAQATIVEWRLGSFALERSEQILWAREVVARETGKIQVTLKGFEGQGRSFWSGLLAHLLDRCEVVVDQVSSS